MCLGSRANTALTAEAVNEIKTEIHDISSQVEPGLEAHIEEISEGLNSLTVKASAISHNQHNQAGGDSSLQISERQRRALEEDRLALEAEKKAFEQSQKACITAREWLAEAAPQFDSQSIHVSFSGANNSGFHLGQNTGVISNLKWGGQS